ncbi:TetR/AcrR family transcriptional regulator [Limibaculum sp. M0105]|uniref:TetR/AcrR family transcriptional regulator n=1 Tax=Thermohalobaculum xanthum TaxID=2753746 RepID=A0A8J7SHM5_9RHOB|nr:TetR/AcrR family transcriptional regulator [Thermohalobaculum xanthum]MBK0399800.1 TetR/AcrR family transcriptional regulator [Thermohalobaculum xanthum]
MARPREFDIDAALDAAMMVFWRKGYENAALPDLLDAMGIARGSLYKAFDDKRTLYLATLDRYEARVVAPALDSLSDPAEPDGVARIQRMMQGACAAAACADAPPGCFMCNAAVDRAPADPEVRARVDRMLQRIEDAIDAALAEGAQTAGWTPERRREAARLLTSAYVGLRVIARAGRPAAMLEAIVGAAISPLQAPGDGAAPPGTASH